MLCDEHFDIMFTVYLIHLIKLKLFLLLYICIFYIVNKSWPENDSPILACFYVLKNASVSLFHIKSVKFCSHKKLVMQVPTKLWQNEIYIQ